MPIVPFLGGAAFEPETIRAMSIALEEVCKDLGLSLKETLLRAWQRKRSYSLRNGAFASLRRLVR